MLPRTPPSPVLPRHPQHTGLAALVHSAGGGEEEIRDAVDIFSASGLTVSPIGAALETISRSARRNMIRKRLQATALAGHNKPVPDRSHIPLAIRSSGISYYALEYIREYCSRQPPALR